MNIARDADRVSARRALTDGPGGNGSALRALRADGTGPLPQYAFPDLDITVEMAVDPDKTLEVMPDPDKTLERRPVSAPPAGVAPVRWADGTDEVRIEDVLEEALVSMAPRAKASASATQEIQAIDILEDEAAPVVRPRQAATFVLPRSVASLVLPPPPVEIILPPELRPVAKPLAPAVLLPPPPAAIAAPTPAPAAVVLPPPPAAIAATLPPPPVALVAPPISEPRVVAPSPGAYAYAGREVGDRRASVAPVSMSARTRADSTFLIAAEPDEMDWLPRRRFGWVIATAAALAVGVLAAALTAQAGDGKGVAVAQPPTPQPHTASTAAPRAAAAAQRPVAATPRSSDESVPVVAVDSLPRAPVGTVVGSPDHRLYVDGSLMHGYTAVVRCGPHSVRVGSLGRTQLVDVPCGSEIVVR